VHAPALTSQAMLAAAQGAECSIPDVPEQRTTYPLLASHIALVLFGSFHMLPTGCCGAATSVELRTHFALSNCFDCASAPAAQCEQLDGGSMYAVVAGAVILLSIGILIAHAMDGFRSG
jgi:hypothetical protein